MNLPSKKIWKINKCMDDGIPSLFSSFFSVKKDAGVTSKLTVLDDFDLHLWRAGYLFYTTDNQIFNLIDPAGAIIETAASGSARFWWEFSETKKVLHTLIGVRAVMPQTSLQLVEQHYSLCNEDQKIVAKACLTQLAFRGVADSYLTLQGLRGYQQYYNLGENALVDVEKIEVIDYGHGLKTILMDHPRHFFEASRDFKPSIMSGMPVEIAVRSMAQGLLNAAGVHVNGMVSDTDTEFLHQFRVSLRKLRSLISLLKKSLPQATIERLKPVLSSIAQKTNKLRDLDVFLLDEVKYRELLPENFDDGLSELYTLIQKQRKQEQKKVASYFLSKSYANSIEVCSKELSSAPVYENNMAGKPVLQVVKKLLLNRYYKMSSISGKITSQSVDEEIHELRIEFKKFRYLIEFFVDLLPKKDVVRLIGDIKKIQTVLGDFNDYSTQIIFLKSYIDDDQIEMSKSLCGLIAVLHQKQIKEKRKVDDVLAGFFTESMKNKIDAIFGSTIQGSPE